MTAQEALDKARRVWPDARLRTVRKAGHCDNPPCHSPLVPGDRYLDPGESNPSSAGGFGGYRFCLRCAGGRVEAL